MNSNRDFVFGLEIEKTHHVAAVVQQKTENTLVETLVNACKFHFDTIHTCMLFSRKSKQDGDGQTRRTSRADDRLAISRPSDQEECQGQNDDAIFRMDTTDVVHRVVERDKLKDAARHAAQSRQPSANPFFPRTKTGTFR